MWIWNSAILSWLRLSWTLSVCQTFSFCGHPSPNSIIIRNMTPKIFQFCSVCNILFVEQTQTPNHDHISGSRRLISPCDLNCYPYLKMLWWYFKFLPILIDQPLWSQLLSIFKMFWWYFKYFDHFDWSALVVVISIFSHISQCFGDILNVSNFDWSGLLTLAMFQNFDRICCAVSCLVSKWDGSKILEFGSAQCFATQGKWKYLQQPLVQRNFRAFNPEGIKLIKIQRATTEKYCPLMCPLVKHITDPLVSENTPPLEQNPTLIKISQALCGLL